MPAETAIINREGGVIGMFLKLVPKVFNNVFLFVCFGDLIELWLVRSNVLATDFDLQKG